MEQARLVRAKRFRATHHYARREWSEERNRQVFGAQCDPHEHAWRVEAHVRGPLDPDTGWCVDLSALDSALDSVLEGWDGGDLNTLIPEVSSGSILPSTESLARWLFERVSTRVPAPARLVEIRVFESDELGAAYPG